MRHLLCGLLLLSLVGCGPVDPIDWVLPGPFTFSSIVADHETKDECTRPGCRCEDPCPMGKDCRCGPDPDPVPPDITKVDYESETDFH